MPIDTSLLRPVAPPQQFNYAGLQDAITQGQARDTNLTAGGLAAQGDFQGASARALAGGNPQLAGQVFDLGNQQHAAALQQGIQKLMQINNPQDWERVRQSVKQTGGSDIGGFDQKDKAIQQMVDASNPQAAVARKTQESQFERTLNKPVVEPYGSNLVSPASGQRIGGQPQGADTGDVLSGVDPQIANMVKGVANYTLDLSSLPRSGPVRQQVLGLVQQYDPTFSAANYPARAATIKSFAVGPDSQNITSLNTAIGHLGTLYDSIDGLNNTNKPVVGNIYNMAKNAIYGGGGGEQAAAIQKFNQAAKAVGDELAKSFKGAGAAGEAEVATWRKGLDAANSPDQLKAAISQGVELLRSRVESMQSKYTSAMGAPMKARMIDPSKAAVLTHMGIDPGELDPNYQPPTGGSEGGQGPAPPAAPPGGTQIQAGSQGNPIQVATPEDAMRLPVGTVFTTPDGRTKVR